jgi:hypothetical protein
MKKNKESYSIHVYTLRDKTTKSIKIESWRSLREEMQVLGITDSDIFQIQMIEIEKNKKVTYCNNHYCENPKNKRLNYTISC